MQHDKRQKRSMAHAANLTKHTLQQPGDKKFSIGNDYDLPFTATHTKYRQSQISFDQHNNTFDSTNVSQGFGLAPLKKPANQNQ